MATVLTLIVLANANAATPELVVCSNGLHNTTTQTFTVVPSGGPITSGDGRCVDIDESTKGKGGAGFCDPRGHGCLGLRPCAGAPQWKVAPRGATGVSDLMLADGSACVDFFGGTKIVQAYNCVGSPNQGWRVNTTAKTIAAAWFPEGTLLSVAGTEPCDQPGPPPPPPADPFCAAFHPIRAPGVYDPSGPLLDQSGTWHTWEDDGAWSHWTSKDLIHWNGSFTDSSNFGGDTGSVSPTPSGVYAFWPIMNGEGKGAIGSAKATNAALTQWDHRGATIPMPSRINTGYRDPVRAFEFNNKWYVGVGCGNHAEGAQFCLFEAEDDTLANFTDRGSLYTTNVTFGEVDANIVWQPTNVSANMMECPDLFPLGDKWVLVGSLYKTNQWWVGDIAATGPGGAPRFTPEQVGILDYGNGYAAKTGTTWVQSGDGRRLVFGFTGWSEPTMPAGCGRALIIPRELHVDGPELKISPIPETAVLRKAGSRVAGTGDAAPIASGSRVEVRLNCTVGGGAIKGKIGVRTLATADGSSFTEIGYDFDAEAFYADHSKCCKSPNTIVQRAPLPASWLQRDGVVSLAAFVDGGLIEAFLGGRVITPLVAPDASAASPEDRTTTITNTAGLSCQVESWQLSY